MEEEKIRQFFHTKGTMKGSGRGRVVRAEAFDVRGPANGTLLYRKTPDIALSKL